jgi:hypothetical protein
VTEVTGPSNDVLVVRLASETTGANVDRRHQRCTEVAAKHSLQASKDLLTLRLG